MKDAVITAAPLKKKCGNISDMSLWRWLRDPDLGFPRPFYINGRRFWYEAEVDAWLESRKIAAE